MLSHLAWLTGLFCPSRANKDYTIMKVPSCLHFGKILAYLINDPTTFPISG